MNRNSIIIHIGYHKSGSTWLQESLFREDHGFANTDPEFPRHQIVRHFARPDDFAFDVQATRGWYQPAMRRAADHGEVLAVSHERLSGYPPSGGYDRKLIADRLAATFPEARILIVIREQVSVIASMYSQYITDGGHLPLRRFLSTPEPGLGRMPGFRWSFYEFDLLIGYYRQMFGQDRVLVLPFELLLQDPQEFASSIMGFMGLSPKPLARRGSVNRRRPVPMQTVQRHVNRLLTRNELSNSGLVGIPNLSRRFARLRPFFEAMTPATVDAWLNQRRNAELMGLIGDHYAQSNRRTSALIGIDLSALGYAPSLRPAGLAAPSLPWTSAVSSGRQCTGEPF